MYYICGKCNPYWIIKQANMINKLIMDDIEITRNMLNERYVAAIEFLIETFTLKNKREFAARMNESPTILSSIKSGHRNASLAQLTKLINDFNLNANFFFKSDNTNEPVELSATNVSASVSGNAKDVTIGQTVSKIEGEVSGSYYNNVEKLINESSPEVKEHIRSIQADCDRLEQERVGLKEEVIDLKRNTDHLQKQNDKYLEQNKELTEEMIKAKNEIIDLLKNQAR